MALHSCADLTAFPCQDARTLEPQKVIAKSSVSEGKSNPVPSIFGQVATSNTCVGPGPTAISDSHGSEMRQRRSTLQARGDGILRQISRVQPPEASLLPLPRWCESPEHFSL
mmetsp:Transcript_6911/g.14964  ORF Transcript_6911/g.14964 Transcript_6911/m.14964 type:complete len:112 (-) Transcript_6911:47-382(-)